MHAEAADLEAQRFTQAFERELGGAVQALIRNTEQAANGSDIHDVSRTPAAECRQDGPANP